MKINVSTGEIFDKVTILELKLLYIKDESKITNIDKEYSELNFIYDVTDYWNNKSELQSLVRQLYNTNNELWHIEDQLRIKEKNKAFDDDFIQLARSVYQYNDRRSELKKKINELTKSELVEEKGYEKYE